MGLDFTKPAASPAPADQNTATPAVQEETYPQYNIVADRQQMDQTLTGSQEVDELASKIEVYHLETIVSFGAEAADEISKCSDVILNGMDMSQLDNSSVMLNTLAKIMDKFDIEELKDNPGLFNKLFGTKFTSSSNSMRARSSSPTASWRICSRQTWAITISW